VEPAQLTVEQHTFPEYWCVCCQRGWAFTPWPPG
jgi:hypothetical protein